MTSRSNDSVVGLSTLAIPAWPGARNQVYSLAYLTTKYALGGVHNFGYATDVGTEPLANWFQGMVGVDILLSGVVRFHLIVPWGWPNRVLAVLSPIVHV